MARQRTENTLSGLGEEEKVSGCGNDRLPIVRDGPDGGKDLVGRKERSQD